MGSGRGWMNLNGRYRREYLSSSRVLYVGRDFDNKHVERY
jgi:hypothetical protein